MKNLNKAKEVYQSIHIPKHLSYVVNKAIGKNGKKEHHPWNFWKPMVSTISCVFLAFVFMLNVSPSFATTVSEIPILGEVAKVFTIEEYHKEDEEKLINAKIPAIENTGNTELEQRVNYEIMLKINEILEEAEQRASEYKKAVLETGGTEEDYQPINIQIDYKVGYSNNQVISFVIWKSETLASAYTESYFYNIDIKTGKNLNLKDVLGNNYKQIVDETIEKEIEERSKKQNMTYFTKEEGGFTGIENEYQDFYINTDGKVVIVFPKYQIAPGSMGTQEFVIEEPIDFLSK